MAAPWHHRPMPLLLISRCSPRQSKVPNARQVTLLCSQDWNHGVKGLEFRVWDSGKSLHPSLFPDMYKNIYFSGGFPSCTDSKESDCNAEDLGSIPGSARSPGERNDNQLQYSCLENPMDRGAWRAEVHWALSRSLMIHWPGCFLICDPSASTSQVRDMLVLILHANWSALMREKQWKCISFHHSSAFLQDAFTEWHVDAYWLVKFKAFIFINAVVNINIYQIFTWHSVILVINILYIKGAMLWKKWNWWIG